MVEFRSFHVFKLHPRPAGVVRELAAGYMVFDSDAMEIRILFDYCGALREIRDGKLTAESLAVLNSLRRAAYYEVKQSPLPPSLPV